jgi:hypothetical protein
MYAALALIKTMKEERKSKKEQGEKAIGGGFKPVTVLLDH